MPKRLINKNGLYFITGITTPLGNTVCSTNKRLIQTIFDENQNNERGYCPEQMGLYSVYCTYIDFIKGFNIWNDQFVLALINQDHIVGYGCGKEGCQGHFKIYGLFKLCIDLYRNQGWDENLLVESQSKISTIGVNYSNYLSSLTCEQQAVVCILNGMLSVDITLIILYLNNLIDLEVFRQNKFEIDSPESTEIYKTVDSIKMWIDVTQGEAIDVK